MAEIIATTSLLNLLQTAMEYKDNDVHLYNATEMTILQNAYDNKSISIDSLKLLSKYLKHEGKGRILHSFIKGQQRVLHFPMLKPPSHEVSEEVKKRREYLTMRQQTREYNQMIHGSDRPPSESDSISASLKSAKYQMAVSSNMIVTLFAMFGVCYYGGTKLGYSQIQCLMLGLAGSIVMFVIEMILYIIRATKMETYSSNSGKKTDMKITS
mmetsp:Transcript_8552/g.12766  ORF Transcript_8552/g.12766 Transcript_8552/m.12766 type:complete len:212 (+) Transcript_8552:48-683(+)